MQAGVLPPTSLPYTERLRERRMILLKFVKFVVALCFVFGCAAAVLAQDNPPVSQSETSSAANADAQVKMMDGQPVYKVGHGITPPKGTHMPQPKYSKEARKAKYQGTCLLWLIVGTDGRPHNIKVARSLGMGLDENAIEAVQKWRFQPATKDGQPVAVQINVEVSFRLY